MMIKKLSAFSILETILSLTVLGILSSSSLIVYKYISHKNAIEINDQKFNYIRIAMQNYLLQHGNLPMAANDDTGVSTTNHQGFVPYRSLGIPKTYMYDYNKKPFKYIVNPLFTTTNIKLQIPLSSPPKNNETSFLRLYHYQDGILYYDYHIKDNKLEITENGLSVIGNNNHFFALPPIKPFNHLSQFSTWISSHQEEDRYMIKNTIAWVLISIKNTNSQNAKNDYKFVINNVDTIFFQSRFDMAAQIGFYSTPEPIYEE